MKNFSEDLRNIINQVIQSENRINQDKQEQYWYPLSMATYGDDEILNALDSMTSFRTSMSTKTLKFEKEFSKWQNCSDSVMVNSGSSADLLLSMLMTNPIDPLIDLGSEVLMPVVTWPTQIWSVLMAGLKVKFVDVDPNTLNIDIEDLKNKITTNTKAIFLVHLMGNPCNMDEITKIADDNNLFLLEDCAEAMGAKWNGIKVGNFGIGAIFSFFFSHHITTMEGGMISLNNSKYAEHLKIMRAHGWTRNIDNKKLDLDKSDDIDSRYAFVNWGLNVRPTEVQAAFGLEQIKKADIFSNKREYISQVIFDYIKELGYFDEIVVHEKAHPSWLGLPIMVSSDAPFSMKDITTFLEESGIETRPIVTGNILKQPVSKTLFPEYKNIDFHGADEIHNRGFYIGLSPMISDDMLVKLKSTFDNFLSGYSYSSDD